MDVIKKIDKRIAELNKELDRLNMLWEYARQIKSNPFLTDTEKKSALSRIESQIDIEKESKPQQSDKNSANSDPGSSNQRTKRQQEFMIRLNSYIARGLKDVKELASIMKIRKSTVEKYAQELGYKVEGGYIYTKTSKNTGKTK